MSQETLYELYFAHVAGHIVDVRDIAHISPVQYDKYDEEYCFQVTQKGAADYNSVRIAHKLKPQLTGEYEVLVAAHAKLWLPYPDAEKTNGVDEVEPTMATDGSLQPETPENV